MIETTRVEVTAGWHRTPFRRWYSGKVVLGGAASYCRHRHRSMKTAEECAERALGDVVRNELLPAWWKKRRL